MNRFLILILAILASPVGPTLSHGYNKNCSEECNDYYCPLDQLRDKKDKNKNNISSKK
tara:strand:+ start:195 stop:368 length:174 start_codon:yes stop_codon:yes gene_type:complete